MKMKFNTFILCNLNLILDSGLYLGFFGFSEVDKLKIQKNPHLNHDFFQVRTSVSDSKILL